MGGREGLGVVVMGEPACGGGVRALGCARGVEGEEAVGGQGEPEGEGVVSFCFMEWGSVG